MAVVAYTCVYDAPGERAWNHGLAFVAMQSYRFAGHKGRAVVFGSGADAGEWAEKLWLIGVDYVAHSHPDWSCRFMVPVEFPEIFSGAGHVLYFDNDCLFLRGIDPWLPMIDRNGRPCDVLVAETPTPMRAGKGFGCNIPAKLLGGDDLLGICAGHLLATGAAAPELFRQWGAAYGFAGRRKGFLFHDQSALNRVVYDSECGGVFAIPFRFGRLPVEDIAILSVFSRYGGHVRDGHVMVHYNRKNKQTRLARMTGHLSHMVAQRGDGLASGESGAILSA